MQRRGVKECLTTAENPSIRGTLALPNPGGGQLIETRDTSKKGVQILIDARDPRGPVATTNNRTREASK